MSTTTRSRPRRIEAVSRAARIHGSWMRTRSRPRRIGLATDRPIRVPSGTSVGEASSGRPAMTDRARATSATVLASGPDSASPPQFPALNRVGTTPVPGLMVTRPQAAAGMRSDPMPSSPIASGTIPEATAVAEPPEDPPEVRDRSRGLRVMPWASESVIAHVHSWGVAVIPTGSAPAASSGVTTGLSRVTVPLIARGTPARGSLARWSGSIASTAAPAARPSARRIEVKACRVGSASVIRSMAASRASRAPSSPERTASAVSMAVGSGLVTAMIVRRRARCSFALLDHAVRRGRSGRSAVGVRR